MDPIEAELWARVGRGGNERALDELAKRYMPWAAAIARSVHRRVWAYPVDSQDFVQNATMGLLEAMARFDPKRGISFQTYAKPRVRGAVFNGLRAILGDRNPAIEARRFAERSESLQETDGDDPFESIIGSIIGLGIGYMLDDVAGMSFPGGDCTQAYAHAHERKVRLERAVDRLPVRLREIVRMHYFRHTPFATIAEDWGLTKGRISQLHKAALASLRSSLRELE